ncbi:MAG: SDR family oxidoreductase [Verrucomicrobiaceae bacterium]|nr:MAG: SDR family oxidoreductase [Verrucomicrobiaceae bacterium]
MKSFHGCTALITGASSGIGREIARQLAPQARELILVARRMDRLEELRKELARPGLSVQCHSVDVANEQDLAAFLQKVQAFETPVDFLINNAGVGDHGFFEKTEWSRVKAMLDINVQALTQVTHALLPQLIRSGRGAVLNVSSIASLLPIPKMSVYAATKAYVTSFSEGIRAELRGTGVSVTALCPGPVDTEFFHIAERPDATESAPAPEFFKVPVEQVAREALDAVLRDKARIIPGWQVWLIMSIATLVPIAIVRLFLSERRKD